VFSEFRDVLPSSELEAGFQPTSDDKSLEEEKRIRGLIERVVMLGASKSGMWTTMH
jgi:hypothetical protein